MTILEFRSFEFRHRLDIPEAAKFESGNHARLFFTYLADFDDSFYKNSVSTPPHSEDLTTFRWEAFSGINLMFQSLHMRRVLRQSRPRTINSKKSFNPSIYGGSYDSALWRPCETRVADPFYTNRLRSLLVFPLELRFIVIPAGCHLPECWSLV